jgi:tRNA dimethylallyltransferase
VSDKDISNKLLVVIGGPTGVGKTAVSYMLARHYQSEIINADSRQIYKELNIGVGKPTVAQLSIIPQHFIGTVSIFQHYSAGQYLKDALALIDSLFTQHDILFLTGGTGLYIKSILEGMDDMPDVPDEVRIRWTHYWKENGNEGLINALKKFDPAYLAVVDQSNPMRMIRALAVSEYSGKPFSSFHVRKENARPFRILPILLELPRKELYAQIDQRVLDMIDQGWLDEARSLYANKNLKALQTVGYKELFEVIEGNITLEEAIPKIQQATRRYAKRQMTWWRHQGEWISADPHKPELIINLIDSHVPSNKF